MTQYVGHYNYWVVIFLMMTGFYIVIARSNLIQKIIGLNIFQISVFLLYITMGKVTGGTAPILPYHHDRAESVVQETQVGANATIEDVAAGNSTDIHAPDVPEDHEPGPSNDHLESHVEQRYSHPLPSVLMLTAIVVGVATTALALALVIRIGEAYGTIEEDEILARDRNDQ